MPEGKGEGTDAIAKEPKTALSRKVVATENFIIAFNLIFKKTADKLADVKVTFRLHGQALMR